MILLDGKKVSNEIISDIKEKIENNNIKVGFAIIWIGNDEASSIYVRNKIKKCEKVGIKVELFHLDESIKEEEVLDLIDKLNIREDIQGILLQSPTPKHIDEVKCFNRINYKKDIDGFSKESAGRLYLGHPYHVSCTPKGIIKLLDYYNIPIEGKNVCIVNRSNIVGKPLMHLFLSRNATVTVCHSKTTNLAFFTKNADILVSAVGKVNFITEDMVKDGTVVIDVGISRVDGHVIGDVDFDRVSPKCSYITPVPGGIGPMTIAMVIDNLLETKEDDING